jgi:hypothetical protein
MGSIGVHDNFPDEMRFGEDVSQVAQKRTERVLLSTGKPPFRPYFAGNGGYFPDLACAGGDGGQNLVYSILP